MMTHSVALKHLRKVSDRMAAKASTDRYVDVVHTTDGGQRTPVRQYLSMKEGSPAEYEALRALGIKL